MGLSDRIKKKAQELEQPKQATATTQYDIVEAFLSQHWEFRYNSIFGRLEMRERIGREWQETTDREVNTILRRIRHQGIKCTKTLLDETLDSGFVPSYNPFELYFSTLPKYIPTKPSVIQALANTVTLEDETQRKVFNDHLRKWLIACAGNATSPDHINELILVLLGSQGDGKTRWVDRLIPKMLWEHQHTGMVKPDQKDSETLLVECFLINLDEMATLRKNDIEGVKSYSSKKKIRLRRPHDKRAQTLIRRANIVGTDNEDQIIPDPTGSRRFLIYKVKETNYEHEVNIDEVYSEALHLFQKGERYWLTKEEIKALNANNEQYSLVTAEEDLVGLFFEEGDGFYTATDIIRHINFEEGKQGRAVSLQVNQATLKKVGGACKKLGFDRKAKRIGGKIRYGYVCQPVSSSLLDNTPHEAPF